MVYPQVLRTIPKDVLWHNPKDTGVNDNFCIYESAVSIIGMLSRYNNNPEFEKNINKLTSLYLKYEKYCKPIKIELINETEPFFESVFSTQKCLKFASVLVLSYFHKLAFKETTNIIIPALKSIKASSDDYISNITLELINLYGLESFGESILSLYSLKNNSCTDNRKSKDNITLQEALSTLNVDSKDWNLLKSEDYLKAKLSSLEKYLSQYSIFLDITKKKINKKLISSIVISLAEEFSKAVYTSENDKFKNLSLISESNDKVTASDITCYLYIFIICEYLIDAIKDAYLCSDVIQETEESIEYYKNECYLLREQLEKSEAKVSSALCNKDNVIAKKNEEISKLKKSMDSVRHSVANEYKNLIKSKDEEINALQKKLTNLNDIVSELEIYKELVESDSTEKECDCITASSQNELNDLLNKYKVCLIGGHDNLLKKMKIEFPDLTLVDYNGSGFDIHNLVRYDFVVINSYNIAHSVYDQAISTIRKNNIAYGYLVNRSANVDIIGKDIIGLLKSGLVDKNIEGR